MDWARAARASSVPRAGPGPSPRGLVHVAWDIENCHLGLLHTETGKPGGEPDDGSVDVAVLVRELKSELVRLNLCHRDDRVDIHAYHNSRAYLSDNPGKRIWALAPERVDQLNRCGVFVVDQGEKDGAADVRLRTGLSDLAENVRDYGLQCAAAVLISSDSDFADDLVRLLRLSNPDGSPIRVVLVHSKATFKEVRSHGALYGNFSSLSYEALKARALPEDKRIALAEEERARRRADSVGPAAAAAGRLGGRGRSGGPAGHGHRAGSTGPGPARRRRGSADLSTGGAGGAGGTGAAAGGGYDSVGDAASGASSDGADAIAAALSRMRIGGGGAYGAGSGGGGGSDRSADGYDYGRGYGRGTSGSRSGSTGRPGPAYRAGAGVAATGGPPAQSPSSEYRGRAPGVQRGRGTSNGPSSYPAQQSGGSFAAGADGRPGAPYVAGGVAAFAGLSAAAAASNPRLSRYFAGAHGAAPGGGSS